MTKRFKVMHIVTTLELGGAQKNTLYTVNLLDRKKYELFLISGKEGMLHDTIHDFKDVHVFFLKHLVRKVSFVKDFLALFQLYGLIRRHKIDIVHTHSTKAGILGRIAAKLAFVPVIIHTAHGWAFHDFQSFITRKVYVLFERFCALFSSALVAVSDETIYRGLRAKIGKKAKYIKIHSAIEGKKFRQVSCDLIEKRKQLGLNEKDFVVLNIACFKLQKNHFDFIEAAKDVVEFVPHAKFVLIGDGELREGIVSKISAYHLEKNFLLLSWRQDVPELMKMADLIGMTSLFEGLPQVCLQALAAGKPMVMYGVDGIKEVIQDGKNGFVITPKDKHSFAQRLIELAQDPIRLKKMEQESLQRWKVEYDITDMVKKIDFLYQRYLPVSVPSLEYHQQRAC